MTLFQPQTPLTFLHPHPNLELLQIWFPSFIMHQKSKVSHNQLLQQVNQQLLQLASLPHQQLFQLGNLPHQQLLQLAELPHQTQLCLVTPLIFPPISK